MRESRLIQRLKDRDERAFRELVVSYQTPVFNLVFRMLGNRQEAEDVAQEVFVSVFKSIHTFRGDCKLSTWLLRIATNHCHNRYKFLARRHYQSTRSWDQAPEGSLDTATEGAPPLKGEVATPDEALAGRQLEDAIERELAALDEEHRMLIVLRDIQGLSYQEIEAITGLPGGTVKSRLHRARMALKDRLEKYV